MIKVADTRRNSGRNNLYAKAIGMMRPPSADRRSEDGSFDVHVSGASGMRTQSER